MKGICSKCNEEKELDDLGMCESCSSKEYQEPEINQKNLRYIDKCNICGREQPIYAHNLCILCYKKKHDGVGTNCYCCGFDGIWALSLKDGKTVCSNCRLSIRWGLIKL